MLASVRFTENLRALAQSGRLDDARLTLCKMLTYADHPGLNSEEVDSLEEAIDNCPRAFTHLALIAAALNLDRQFKCPSGDLAHFRRPLRP